MVISRKLPTKYEAMVRLDEVLGIYFVVLINHNVEVDKVELRQIPTTVGLYSTTYLYRHIKNLK